MSPNRKRLSKRHQIRLSQRDNTDLINKMRQVAKKDPGVIEKFKEYRIPLKHIDHVSIQYADLGVSAKTKGGKIYLNNRLLASDNPFDESIHYVVHELAHVLQQLTGQHNKGSANDRYIDKPTEEEAFMLQIDYKRREEGPEEAEEYVDGLLEHHNLKGKDKEEKKKELLPRKR